MGDRGEANTNRLARVVHHLTIVGIAGVVSGLLVGGVGGRLFMRVAGAVAPRHVQGIPTEAGNRIGEVTIGGSLGLIIFIGIFTGAAGAAFYVIARPWLEWAGRYRGLVFGVFLFGVTSATSDVLNPDNPDFFFLGNHALVVAMAAALFIGYGLSIELLVRRLEGTVPVASSRRALIGRSLFVAAGALLVSGPLVLAALFTDQTCDCDPPMIVGWFVLLAAGGTALWWLGNAKTRRAAIVLGYGGLAGAAVFGLIRAIADSIEIIT